MEVKSVNDCLNIIDFAIVEINIGSSDLENIGLLYETCLDKYILKLKIVINLLMWI